MSHFVPRRRLILGCGYLGIRVARLWLERGDEVAAITRSAARADLLAREGIQPILGDVTAAASLRGLPPVETLLYAIGLDRRSGHSQREVYVDGLQNLVTALGAGEGVPRRVIYISSTSVYGQDDGSRVDETTPAEPVAENGRICLEAERLIQRAFPDSMVVRSAGIYGPGRLVARVESLRAGIPLSGDPDSWLNLIHVDDLAQIVLSCEERGRLGATYLACDDRPIHRGEYYSTVARLVGAPPPVFEPGTAKSGRTTGLNKRCCNRAIRDQLGVALRYPTIESGLPAALGAEATELP